MPLSFERQLDQLDRRLRRLAWMFGLCRTTAVAAMLVAFIGALDVVLRFDSPILRAGLLLAWAITVIGVAIESLYRPLRGLPSHARIAEKLERRFEPLRGSLAAAVEFTGEGEITARDSASLRKTVIAAADTAAGEIDFREILDSSTARQAAIHAGVAAAILLVLAVCFPTQVRTATVRFFVPFSLAEYRVDDELPLNGVEAATVPPTVRLDRVELDAPAYAASTVDVRSDRIQTLVGSMITLFGTSDRAVASVSVVDAPTAKSTIDGERFSISWILRRGGFARVRVEDREGLVGEATSREIYLIEDRPPTVRRARPADGLFAVPKAVLRVDATVTDDFGIATVEFIVAKKEAITGKVVENHVSLMESDEQDVAQKKVMIRDRKIPLSSFLFKPGEETAVWIEAVDLGGKTTAGVKRRIAIVSAREAGGLLERALREWTDAAARLLEQQKACLVRTRMLSSVWKNPPSAELIARLKERIDEQARIAGALRDPDSGLVSRFARLLETTRINGDATEEAGRLLEAVDARFVRPALPLLGELERTLRRPLRDPSSSLETAVALQTRLMERWKAAIELLRRQEAFFDLGAALEGLIYDQEELRARLGLLLPKTRGKRRESLSPEVREELEVRLEGQQKLKAKWLELAARIREEKSLENLFDNLLDTEIEAKMISAAEAIEGNRLETAIETQDAVLALLTNLRQRLEGAMQKDVTQAAPEDAPAQEPNDSQTEGTPSEGTAEGASDEAMAGGDPSAPPESRAGSIEVEAAERAARLMEGLWGMLPPRMRPAVRQLPTAAFPPEYAPLIEAYFRELSRTKSDGPRN